MHQTLQGSDELLTRAQALYFVSNQPLLDCKKAVYEFARDCDALARLRDERACRRSKLVTTARPGSVPPLLSALDRFLLKKAGIEIAHEREKELAGVAANLGVALQHRAALLRTYVATSADGALLATVRFERDDGAVDYLLSDHWSGLRLRDGP